MNVETLSSAVYRPGLPGSAYSFPPPARSNNLNTIVEDEATVTSYYFASRYSTASQPDSILSPQAAMLSPAFSEDFPTPRANTAYHDYSMTSPAESEFDSLYDISDDDSEIEVPLKCSNSVKKTTLRPTHTRYPSISIPSPSTWPTIEKFKSAMSPVAPTPSGLLSPSKNILNMLAARSLQIPASSATPSLDGSMTSDEMEHLSCPSTPDLAARDSASDEDDASWLPPVQLHPQAFETLQHLRDLSSDGEDEHREDEQHQVTPLIEIPEGEMTEVTRPRLGLNVAGLNTSDNDEWENEPVSALSIPSPGGFFSSLDDTTRGTWSLPEPESLVPTTTTAERFYNVPWDPWNQRDNIVEQTINFDGSTVAGTDGPPTSKFWGPHVDEEVEIKEIDPSNITFQYNEKYHDELEKMATANIDRTSNWLTEQDELQTMLRDMSLPADTETPAHSRDNSLETSPKKSVRFQEKTEELVEEEEDDDKPKKIATFVQGFEHLRNRGQRGDAFIHRQTRAEAMHIQRRCLPKVHRDQLLGKFELSDPVRPSPPRPVSSFYTDDPTVLKERIARAQMERQALDQMSPVTWVLQAQKFLNGGRLLSQPSCKSLSRVHAPRILDVGGQPTCDWAWQVAFDHPRATVTTVYPPGHALATSTVAGPANHKQMPVPNLWTLPFPSGHFNVISARSLYALLKTDKPVGRTLDEYDLCLKECFRCLKPGGYLEFSLIDSDIIRAGRQAQAMGVEFGFNLKTRGYDPQPTKTFLPRLGKAGFEQVQRAWMILPMGKPAANWRDALPVGAEAKMSERSIGPNGDVAMAVPEVLGSTLNASNLTGTVGAWAWEKWMLKLQLEMGKEEEKLLEGVVQVLEEGAKDGAGWRSLTGWARKPAEYA